MTSVANGANPRVLVVGAGPAGLVAALGLREQGLAVRVVDEQAAESKRTYPALLHARTLRILAKLGVSAPLEWRGRAITRLSIYSDGLRRGLLELPSAEPVAPGALTLPQDVLRRALTARLADLGVGVQWQTRVVALEQDAARAKVSLVRRERVESPVPELRPQWLDVHSETCEAELVIGADGVHSSVRQLLGIGWLPRGERRSFAFYDARDERAGDTAHLVIAETLGNAVYPLQGNSSRFSFEVSVGMARAPGARQLGQLLAARLPWYAAKSESFEWSGAADFQLGLASRFGEGRVWLVGDAAHSTLPLGGQSLNVGIHEANELGERMADALGRSTPPSFGPHYSEQRRIEWQRLFGLGPSRPDADRAPDWVKRHIQTLLPSLPASGDDLDDLLDQLHVKSA
jgi:2-polyprenyl-6-methoxyphenol hydroxylase-like FAD-dependent oxidoreductase